MKASDVLPYLTCEYQAGGEGPVGYNCWGLLRHIQRVHFGRELPAVTIGNEEETRQAHETALASGLYWPIDKPEHGAAALLRGGNDPHVGVWLEIDGGGVLHALEGVGIVWSKKSSLRMLGFARVKFYRVKDARSLHSSEGSFPSDD